MSANEHQVGGTHYKTDYEHWDLVLATGMGYLEGCATKYIARWRKKDGVADLKKALHYVNKLLENIRVVYLTRPVVSFDWVTQEVDAFAAANKLNSDERLTIHSLAVWRDPGEVRAVQESLCAMIEAADTRAAPVPAEDSNKHADRVEPLVPRRTPLGSVQHGGVLNET